MGSRSKSHRLAFLLSGVMPGLGQFYNEDWLKGIGFFVGSMVLSGFAFSDISMIDLLQGAQPVSVGPLLLRLTILSVFWVWCIFDADRSARRKNAAPSISSPSS